MLTKGKRPGSFMVLGFIVLVATAGCGDEEPELVDGGAVVVLLTDGQIGTILITANRNEVSAGQIAQTRASNSQVLAFANRMVNEHTAAIDNTQTLLRGQSITPADSNVNQQLLVQAAQLAPQLQAATAGTNFDFTYMCSQIRAHAQLVALADARLLPSVQNAVLRTDVQTTRTLALDHLGQAQSIVQSLSLQSSSTSPQDGFTDLTAAACANFGGVVPPALPTN
jgi:putative membrane protein